MYLKDRNFFSYLCDHIVRSFEGKEELYSCLNPDIHREFFVEYIQRTSIDRLLENVYRLTCSTVNKNLRIGSSDDRFLPPESLEFDWRKGFCARLQDSDYVCYLGKVFLPDTVSLKMGRMSYFSGRSTIRGAGKLSIGAFSCLAEGIDISVSSFNHPTSYPAHVNFSRNIRIRDAGLGMEIKYEDLDEQRSCVEIGNDVWVGRNADIRNGVVLGDGCVVGEGSYVNRDCEPYGIYVGRPAKLIKYRFPPEMRQFLSDLKWWSWSNKKIRQNEKFFSTQISNHSVKYVENIIVF